MQWSNAWDALTKAAERRGFKSFIVFNDCLHTTHADVITMWKDALDILKGATA